MIKFTSTPIKVSGFFLLISILFSCSKDSDLLADYVLQDSIDVEQLATDQNEEDSSHGEEPPPPTDSTSNQNTDFGVLKAFPSAYGGGSQATGGRGGRVIHVTNLNNNGPGSLREAIMASGARIIVFDVSGTIKLSQNINTSYGDFTIAGQTAPAGGITITGPAMFELSGISNVIIRYIRFRPEFEYNDGNADGLQFWNSSNIIVDHCSISWAGDEAIETGGATHDVTFQNLIVGESKTGSIMGNSNKATGGASISYNLSALGNLWFQIDHRVPNTISNNRVDQINNVIYGYGYRLNRPAPSQPRLNEINNYYLSDVARPLHDMNKIDYYPEYGPPQIYSKGNLHLPAMVTNPNLANNNNTWSVFGTSNGAFGFTYKSINHIDDDPAPDDFFTNTQHTLIGDAWPIKTALEAFEYAKTEIGANKRIDGSGNVIVEVDIIDQYYITQMNAGTSLKVAYPFTMAGKPHYENFLSSISSTPINYHPVGYDSDGDGMPDVWETAMGFDPNSQDHNGDADGNGYTNIEEFIYLVDF